MMRHLLGRLAAEESGQDLIEYGLLAAVVSLSATAAILSIGQAVDGLYGRMPGKLP